MRGHVRQRGRSWCFVIDLGRDEQGKRKQKWHSGFPTKKAAEAELAKVLNEVNTNSYIPPTRMTVGEYLEDFLRDYAAHQLAAQTYRRYAGIVRKHLIPALGQIQLSKLQPAHIERCYSVALESGRLKGGSALSSTTVLQHHRVLNKALKLAVRKRLIVHNPAEAVVPPRLARKEMDHYSADEVRILLKHVEGHRFHIPVLLAVTTGMRRGEILGLKWGDIDLASKSLTVQRSLEESKDGPVTKSPKTRSGRRSISLPQSTVTVLKRHKATQAAARLACKGAYNDGNWVCADEHGVPLSPSVLSHAFPGILAAAKLRRIRFHDLRHTCATLLLTSGENPKVVSERLGHSQVQITLDIYSHVTPTMQQQAAEKLEALLTVASN